MLKLVSRHMGEDMTSQL